MDMPLHIQTSGTGPPVVLLHGLALSSYTWRPLVESYQDQFTMHAIDLPGMAGSYDSCLIPWTFGDAIDRLGVSIESLADEPVTLIAHSVGGLFAAALASSVSGYAHRVERLVLISGAATWFMPGWPVRFLALPWLPVFLTRVFGSQVVFRAGLRSTYTDEIDSQDVQQAIRRYASTAGHPDAIRRLGKIIRYLRGMDQSNIEAMHRSIECPVLVLHTRGDNVVPLSVSERFCELVPQAKLQILESSSHVPQETEPDIVRKHIDEWMK